MSSVNLQAQARTAHPGSGWIFPDYFTTDIALIERAKVAAAAQPNARQRNAFSVENCFRDLLRF